MDLQAPRPATSASAPAAAASGAPAGSDTSADGRNTAFRPVEGGTEMQSGEKLLVEAYAAIWVILFVMVLLSWRRQRRLDERISVLSSAIDKARAESDAAEEKASA
jgi:CcmD family protein